ncbi:hypothetical protein EVAR_47827_1 [Eumeta japonica]|uniref:Uncharacterized protein n=1 Tax=Eumeta variegata TaxID=151549 RepID=A0A4C1Z147_EUMVA|nr:hypothetical protein EVAR_47827_1 [Eumeta japonica]
MRKGVISTAMVALDRNDRERKASGVSLGLVSTHAVVALLLFLEQKLTLWLPQSRLWEHFARMLVHKRARSAGAARCRAGRAARTAK